MINLNSLKYFEIYRGSKNLLVRYSVPDIQVRRTNPLFRFVYYSDDIWITDRRCKFLGIWMPNKNVAYSGDLKSEHLKSGLVGDQILNGPVFKGLSYSFNYGPDLLKTGTFTIRPFLSGFWMVFDILVAIYQNFKWLGLRILDPIHNLDLFNYSKSGRKHIWISDPFCIQAITWIMSVWTYLTSI